jgi:hypothetical protein
VKATIFFSPLAVVNKEGEIHGLHSNVARPPEKISPSQLKRSHFAKASKIA